MERSVGKIEAPAELRAGRMEAAELPRAYDMDAFGPREAPRRQEGLPDLPVMKELPDIKEAPREVCELIKNKEDGLRREKDVEKELRGEYPPSEGYSVESEVYLRDKDGNIAKDPVTGEARRIDFVVFDKDGNVVDSVEVTSKTADKTEQSAKEQRIKEDGGNYVKTPDGNLAKIPDNVQTRIERRD